MHCKADGMREDTRTRVWSPPWPLPTQATGKQVSLARRQAGTILPPPISGANQSQNLGQVAVRKLLFERHGITAPSPKPQISSRLQIADPSQHPQAQWTGKGGQDSERQPALCPQVEGVWMGKPELTTYLLQALSKTAASV